MKRITVVLALAFLCGLASTCPAALFTHNASASPGSNPDAGAANVWIVSLSSGDGGQNGSFQGNSNGNGTFPSGAGAGATAWAMYANSGQTATATTTAFSTLSDVSTINLQGQFLSLDFDNGFIDSGASVGISFRDSSNVEQFAFRFLGGNSSYQFTDSANPTYTNTSPTKAFTADGFNTKLLLTSNSGGYTFTAGTTTISGTLKQLSSTIASVVVFNNFAGGGSERNLYFDHFQLSTTPVPEVSAVLAIPVALLVTGVGWRLARRFKVRRTASL